MPPQRAPVRDSTVSAADPNALYFDPAGKAILLLPFYLIRSSSRD